MWFPNICVYIYMYGATPSHHPVVGCSTGFSMIDHLAIGLRFVPSGGDENGTGVSRLGIETAQLALRQ